MLPQMTGSTSSIADFMLDARGPPGGYREEERSRDEQTDMEIKRLMEETHLWRIANSAQWVAWGLMQANIPGLAEKESTDEPVIEGAQPAAIVSHEEEQGDADEFDYLAYAQERAFFFWGDCVLMGIVKLEDFPEEVRSKLKFVEY